jgi:hypothetical protein
MSSTGLSFDIRQDGSGDAVDLFYELEELLCGWVWNVTRELSGFKSYLRLEEFRVWMSDRWRRDPTNLWFAFWEDDVDPTIVAYAIHVGAVCVAKHADEITAMAARHGFAIDLAKYAHPAPARFAMHGASRVCRVLPWRRGEPIDAEPRFGCEPHPGKPPSASQLVRLRACAMTGICACKLCKYSRQGPDPLSRDVALAWQLLDDGDATCAKLAVRVADDGDGIDVMADYFRDRGITLVPLQLVALARSYRDAE